MGTWLNNIGDFIAGEGYYIKVTESTELTITAPALARAEVTPDEDVSEATLPVHFTPVFTGNPFMPTGIYLIGEESASLDLEVGDEVAVFDGELCVGASVVEGEISTTDPFVIIASQDDEMGMPGFIEGNSISFRIWDASESSELLVSAVTNYDVATGDELASRPAFEGLGIVAISFKSLAIDEVAIPDAFTLHQNYPNPFNPVTTIAYDIPEAADVRIDIYNLLGQKVRTLVAASHEPGFHHALWDSRNDVGDAVTTGIYICRITAIDVSSGNVKFTETRKLVLMK